MTLSDEQQYANTDRELFRESTGIAAGSHYENSLHVTARGEIGMDVGGRVVVMKIAEWHDLATGKRDGCGNDLALLKQLSEEPETEDVVQAGKRDWFDLLIGNSRTGWWTPWQGVFVIALWLVGAPAFFILGSRLMHGEFPW